MVQMSVALVTRNRPSSLKLTLRSLREQDVQPFEVVVSDDSDGKLREETARIAYSFGCRYIEGPKKGLYANRNHVVESCLGTHIRTMDDDHLFPPGHFRACHEALERDSVAIWTTGEIGFVNERLFGATPVAFQLHPAGVGCLPSNVDVNWTIADGSTMYPRSVFARGLRFVDEFGYGSSYLEFGAYLFAQGYYSRCLVGAVVEHFAGETTLKRSSPEIQLGRLFASLAYNLYFRRNFLRAIRYLVPFFFLHTYGAATLRSFPLIVSRVRHRWKSIVGNNR